MLLSEHDELTPAHVRLLVLAFVGWLFDYYDLILYTFLTREISRDLHFTKLDHAYALGITFLGTGLGGIACGFLADRYGRRTVIAWTILLYSAGTLLTGLAWDMRSLFLGRVVTGAGVGGEWSAGHSLIAETFPPTKRGRAGALLQTGAPAGFLLATLVGGLLAHAIGWRACFVASSATGLLAFACRRFMPESDLWLAHKAERFGAGFQALLREPALYLGFVLTVVNGTAYWLVYSWLPEYLSEKNPLAASLAYMLAAGLGQLAGYASFGWVSDRLGRRPSFTIYALVMAVALLPLTVLWERFSAEWILAATFLVGVGTGTWSNFGPLLAELFPTSTRNTAMATIFNGSRVLMVVPAAVVPLLAKTHGFASGIALAAAFSVAAAAIVWMLPETRARRL